MNTFDYEGIWKETWGDMQRFGPVHRHHRRIFSKIFKNLPQNEIQTVADIGCGEGSNLVFLKSQFPQAQLFGFDISKTAIESAKRNVNAEFNLLDIQKEIPQQKFDLVFCSDVVEHLEDDQMALKNIKKITNKYAMIATVQGRMRNNEQNIGHVRNYDYGELKQKIEGAGLHVLQIIEWGFPFYSPLFRDFISIFPGSQQFSYGSYDTFQKLVSLLLYVLFLLNRNDKGDVIFVITKP